MPSLRHALRAIRHRPAPFLVASITIALVTAAAGAVTAVTLAAFVRPLPFPDPHRLARLYMQPPGTTAFAFANPLHPLEFVRFHARPAPFESVEGIWAIERAIGGDGDPESVPVGAVSGGFLSLVGGPPVLGRVISPADDQDERRVVVLGHGFWMRRFGGDRGVVGRTLLVDREPYEVIGVMPPDFEPVFTRTELWTPLGFREGRFALPAATFIQTVGRLPPGLTVDQALERARPRFAAIRDESPATLKGWELGVRPLRDAQFGQQQPAILMLGLAVVVLAGIAAANLMHLSVADAVSRRAEIGLRLALGASRGDLLRWHLLDRLTVAAAGGVAGLFVAWLSVPFFVGLDPTGLGSLVPVRLDWASAVVAWTFVTTVMLGASMVPVWRTSRRDLSATVLDGGRRTGSGRGRARLGAALVGAEMGLAVLLVVCGALLIEGLARTADTDPGFRPAGLVGGQLRLPESGYPTSAARAAFARAVLERVRAVPGVTAASTGTNRFVPGFAYVTLVHIEDKPTPTGAPHRAVPPCQPRLLPHPRYPRTRRPYVRRTGPHGHRGSRRSERVVCTPLLAGRGSDRPAPAPRGDRAGHGHRRGRRRERRGLRPGAAADALHGVPAGQHDRGTRHAGGAVGTHGVGSHSGAPRGGARRRSPAAARGSHDAGRVSGSVARPAAVPRDDSLRAGADGRRGGVRRHLRRHGAGRRRAHARGGRPARARGDVAGRVVDDFVARADRAGLGRRRRAGGGVRRGSRAGGVSAGAGRPADPAGGVSAASRARGDRSGVGAVAGAARGARGSAGRPAR